MAADNLNKIRIDHIGSMVRPASLKEVLRRYDRGQASREELRKPKTRRSATSFTSRKLTVCLSSPTAISPP